MPLTARADACTSGRAFLKGRRERPRRPLPPRAVVPCSSCASPSLAFSGSPPYVLGVGADLLVCPAPRADQEVCPHTRPARLAEIAFSCHRPPAVQNKI